MKMVVDGNHILYHYLEKDLRDRDVWLFQMLASRLFTALGIWFSPRTYVECPILLPFAVRDPACRKRKPTDVEAWGAPNAEGYFRDDNSLVKALPKGLPISAPANPIYQGKTIGEGFVASHVWREIRGANVTLSSRDPDTNSFIPNLVWLPKQVAKLTDREGSFAQVYLQALSVKIYRHEVVGEPSAARAARAWEKLPLPLGIPENGLPNVSELAFYEHRNSFVDKRRAAIQAVVDAVHAISRGKAVTRKVISSRYTEGLPKVRLPELMNLLESLLPLAPSSTAEGTDTISP
ncbi:MAG: hypothetical protein HZB33_07015 [Nitrospirae bacterium]|nr:hypothetical protein [Nitrospirota bacterium]